MARDRLREVRPSHFTRTFADVKEHGINKSKSEFEVWAIERARDETTTLEGAARILKLAPNALRMKIHRLQQAGVVVPAAKRAEGKRSRRDE